MVVARSCLSPDDKRVDADGTGFARNRAVRDSSRHDAVSGQQGFTLIEALVVVAIVGFLSTAIMLSLNSYWQRSRLEGGANDVRNFLLTAQNLAIATNDNVLVELRQEGGTTVLTMTPQRPPQPGSLLDSGIRKRLELPPYLVVNGLTLGDGTDWHEYPTGVRNIACSAMSRTRQQLLVPDPADPTGPPIPAVRDIAATRVLRLTHEAIVDGRLFPRTVCEIEVSPLWNVRMLKRRAA